MNKSKVLSVALAAAMIASVSAITASATDVTNDGIEGAEKVGICGKYNEWGDLTKEGGFKDVAMTETSKGIYEGTFTIDAVTEDMFEEHTVDDEKDGKKGIMFKVRCDDSWDNSWGLYEPGHKRCFNSQSNCIIEDKDLTIGASLTVHVKFDTTKADDQAVADGVVDPTDEDEDIWVFWPITFTYEVGSASDTQTETKTDNQTGATDTTDTTGTTGTTGTTDTTDTTNTESTAPADDTKKDDTSAPTTGDATSAAALVAVVLASLGTAVVMTKKASKE